MSSVPHGIGRQGSCSNALEQLAAMSTRAQTLATAAAIRRMAGVPLVHRGEVRPDRKSEGRHPTGTPRSPLPRGATC